MVRRTGLILYRSQMDHYFAKLLKDIGSRLVADCEVLEVK